MALTWRQLAYTDSPVFTGTVTLPTGLTGVIRADSGVVSVDTDVTDIVNAASTSAAGKVELATEAEVATGSDTSRAVTPAGIAQTIQKGSLIYAADAGSTDAYAITLVPTPSAYTTGMPIHFKANTVNTGACTLDVNSLGAKTIKKNYNEDLADGDIKAGQFVSVIYDGTNFQLISSTSNVGATAPVTYRKTANESVSSSTTMQDDNDLVGITLKANKTYRYVGNLLFSVGNPPGYFKYQLVTSANVSSGGGASATVSSSTATSTSGNQGTAITTILSQTSLGYGSVTNGAVVFTGIIIVGESDVTLKLQWAQSSSSTQATTLLTNSNITLWET